MSGVHKALEPYKLQVHTKFPFSTVHNATFPAKWSLCGGIGVVGDHRSDDNFRGAP